MRDLLAEACAKVKTSFAGQPRVEARLRRLIGRTYRNLGLYDQAEQQLPAALEIPTRLLGEADVETIRSLSELASLRSAQEHTDEAEVLNARVLALGRSTLGGEHEVVLQAMHVEADVVVPLRSPPFRGCPQECPILAQQGWGLSRPWEMMTPK
jgi:hypothetical protein